MSENVAMPAHWTSPKARRVAAWFVDWLIISMYAALLIPVGLLISRSVELSAAAANALSFACLVAPVTVWLALWERGPRAASPGKRLLGLRVRAADGGPVGFHRALIRNALKVALPWELGHTAAFTLASTSGTGAEVIGLICSVLACGIALLYATSLIVGSGRTPYDRIAGTQVART